MTYFERIANSDNPVAQDVALFNLGRLYAELGDADKSRTAYRRLISEFQESVYYELVNEKLAG